MFRINTILKYIERTGRNKIENGIKRQNENNFKHAGWNLDPGWKRKTAKEESVQRWPVARTKSRDSIYSLIVFGAKFSKAKRIHVRLDTSAI